ncbi:MAG: hypothetical protein ACLUS5_11425 [Roseburia faecis]
MAEKMMGTGLFEKMLFIEGNHEETMTIDRYMNIWKSVNDIQVQAGEGRISADIKQDRK